MPVQPFESVTLTVMSNVPGAPGVPLRRPALESVRPPGSEPLLRVKVAVPLAPLWPNDWLNAASTVLVDVEGFVTVMTWQTMVRAYVGPTPVQPFESVTLTTMLNVPLCVGVPSRMPVPECSVRPVGSAALVASRVKEGVPFAPLCRNVSLNAVPTVPPAFDGFVTVMVWQVTTSVHVGLIPVQPFESVTFALTGTAPLASAVPVPTP